MTTDTVDSEPYYDLGTYHRAVETPSAEAQLWFDRGLVWAYAFNHDEAIACFEKALSHDPLLSIARWGIAYAIGPNYNKAWDAFDPVDMAVSLARARTELELAAEGRATPAERGLIDALAARFPTDDPNDSAALSAGHTAYADAMLELSAAHPADIDIQTLAADALVNVTAWALWDTRTGEPAPGSRVLEATRILDAALATDAGKAHPGLLHIYLHTMEMSAHPEVALPAADLLRDLVPDAGHLQHMPTHIDVLCGDYRTSVVSNQSAVRADRKFVENEGPLNFYSLYRAHDLHFVVYSAMFSGQFGVALAAAEELAGQLTPELLSIASPPMADWLEAFVPLRTHVLIRFGRWDDLLAQALPDDTALYAATTTARPVTGWNRFEARMPHSGDRPQHQPRSYRDATRDAQGSLPSSDDSRLRLDATVRLCGPCRWNVTPAILRCRADPPTRCACRMSA
ncbi:hypothetical protein MMUR_37480 [Mycolicibacterium murale]|uniref:Tetratricopeptide repeat protein n=1 Tax=Mycolicibacterium murale TaxID=182220 RepID=A0A7I9WPF0_9MYCO|nr:tetratricopeptide repeat protein [Mycolicibacterium murale]GFG59612.1 hypothetical protein MMUR_37480 [Mycolicibacterium murale]